MLGTQDLESDSIQEEAQGCEQPNHQLQSNEKFIEEIKSMNLTKYSSEVAESIAKTEFNQPKNIESIFDFENFTFELKIIADICEIMHHRYEDFQKQLVKSLSKQFKSASEHEDYELRTNKRRTLLFLMTELYIIGIILEYKRIFASLQEIFLECKSADTKLGALNIALLSNYLKEYHRSVLDLNLSKEEIDPSQELPKLLSKDQSDVLAKTLIKFYNDVALVFYNKQYKIYTELKQKYDEDMK